jgi:hypothetical protein
MRNCKDTLNSSLGISNLLFILTCYSDWVLKQRITTGLGPSFIQP